MHSHVFVLLCECKKLKISSYDTKKGIVLVFGTHNTNWESSSFNNPTTFSLLIFFLWYKRRIYIKRIYIEERIILKIGLRRFRLPDKWIGFCCCVCVLLLDQIKEVNVIDYGLHLKWFYGSLRWFMVILGRF